MTTQSTAAPGLPELPELPDYFEDFMDRTRQEVHAYATAHGLACYEAGSAAAAQAVPEWISVGDRLPDERASAYLVAVIAKKTYSEGSNYPGMGIRSVVQDWVARNYASSYTHWMELPETTAAAPTQGAEGAAPQARACAIQDGRCQSTGACQELGACNPAPQAVVGEASERPEFDPVWVDKCPGCPPMYHGIGKDGDQYSISPNEHLHSVRLGAKIGEPADPPTPTAPQEADALREALTELVALKDMKERIELIRAGHTFMTDAQDEADSLEQEYGARKPLAWAAARAALAQHQPQQGEQQ